MDKLRTIVTFETSLFNITKTKDYYINPENYGDDLAKWFADELEKKGATIDRDDEFPGQEDFGWYLCFQIDAKSYCLVIGHRPCEDGKHEWIGWIERDCGLVASFFGERNKKIGKDVLGLIQTILSASDKIANIRWHYREDFEKGLEEVAVSKP